MRDSTGVGRKHVFCEHPKVTVFIPVYKVEKYLTQCLNSVVNQTLEDLEIFVLDEGDHDRCREIIDAFAARDPRIIAPHIRHGGYGKSANYAIRRARGEYFAIVESDDFIEPEMYEEMYAYAKRLDADVVKTPFYEYAEGMERRDCWYRKLLRENLPVGKCFSMKEYGELLQVHPSLWAGLYRIQYLREQKIEFTEIKEPYIDHLFKVKAYTQTNQVAYVDKPYYYWRLDNVGSTNNNWNTVAAMKRWKEVHDYFEDKQDDYDQFYGTKLILEEYICTFEQAFFMDYTHEEWEYLKQNLARTKIKTIEKSNALDRERKKNILAFMRNPDETIEIIKEIKHQWDLNDYAHLSIDQRYCFPWKSVQRGERIVIYNGGAIGKTFIRQTLITKYCTIVCVCDQNPEQSGINPKRYGGQRFRIPVITYEEFVAWKESYYDKILIAVEQEDIANNMCKKLINSGIPANKILWENPLLPTQFMS